LSDPNDEAILLCHHEFSNPDPNATTLLHFHGNGETVEDYTEPQENLPTLLDVLRGHCNVLLSEYRQYCGSTGTISFTRQLNDVEYVHKGLRLPEQQIVVMGRSIGSLPAIHYVSLHPNAKGLVIDSGLARPDEFLEPMLQKKIFGSFNQDLSVNIENIIAAGRRIWDHPRKLREFKGPVLILHARNDDVAPVSFALRMFLWSLRIDFNEDNTNNQEMEELLKSYQKQTKEEEETCRIYSHENKTLVLFRQGTHNSIYEMNHQIYARYLIKFLRG